MSPVTAFPAVFAALLAAHYVGDHWVQTDRQARRKALPGWPGRRACAAHVATYTLTAVAALLSVEQYAHVPVGPGWRSWTGLALSAVTHYVADRRAPLRVFAAALGLHAFVQLGAPRPDRDDQPHLGTGAYALDQSWHVGWLFAAALIIAGGTA